MHGKEKNIDKIVTLNNEEKKELGLISQKLEALLKRVVLKIRIKKLQLLWLK